MKSVFILLFVTSFSVPAFATIGPIIGISHICYGDTTTFTDTTSGGYWTSSYPSIATIDSFTGKITTHSVGTFFIHYTKDTSTVSLLFTVNPQPSVSGDSLVCVGDTITEIVSSGSGGIWTSSNPAIATIDIFGQVIGMSPGTTTIHYMLPAGCVGTIPITVNPTPAPPIITGDSFYCICQPYLGIVVIADTLASLVQYYPTNTGGIGNTTYPTINICITGIYKIFASQTVFGCESKRDSIIISVDSCSLSVNKITANEGITIFPNPTNGIINIGYTLPEKDNYSIFITDIFGHKLYTQNNCITNFIAQIDVTNLKKGLYFIQICNSSINKLFKITIQ